MSQPIFLKHGTLRDAAESADDRISTFKMQLDNSMEHNKTLLAVIENLARCATLIAQDNQYLHEQTFTLQQKTVELDRKSGNCCTATKNSKRDTKPTTQR